MSSLGSATARISNSEKYRLQCYAVDPFCQGMASRGVHWILMLLLPLIVFTGLMSILAAVEGQFGSISDFLKGLKDIRQIVSVQEGYKPPTQLPLLRDVPMQIASASLALQTGNVYRQWIKIATMPEKLIEGRLIVDKDGSLAEEIRKANIYFWRVSDFSLLAGMVAFTVTILILSSQSRNGIYSTYAPAQGQDYGVGLYANWWANIGRTWGAWAMAGMGMLAAYYLILQNAVGLRVLLVILRSTHQVERKGLRLRIAQNDSVEFRLDPGNRDQCRGWAPMDQIFRTIFAAVVASGFALTFLVLQISFDKAGWLAWALIIFLVLNPTYIVVPMMAFKLRLRSWRNACLDSIEDEIHQAAESGAESAEIAPLTSHRNMISESSTWPFAGFRSVPVLFLYLLPLVFGYFTVFGPL